MGRTNRDFIEPVPVDDTFVTKVGAIEPLGNGMIRTYLCVEEGGHLVVKSRLVIPIACAVEMNTEAASILAAEYRRAFPLRVVG